MSPGLRRLLLFGGLSLALLAVHRSGLAEQLSFEALLEGRDRLEQANAARPLLFFAGFVLLYVLVAALSVPGATVLTLAGGAVLGFASGSVAVSFGSSLGATLAMLISRYLLRDLVRGRFGERLKRIDAGLQRDGAFHLLSLRLVPVFPFFLVNLAMGLTGMRPRTFYWVSQLGMLPATLLYVNAGSRLSGVAAPGELVSTPILVSLAALGLLPLALRGLLQPLRGWLALRRFSRPARSDYDIVVLGAGAGGLVASQVGAAAKARVALVERDRMGGDCLNTGCVPSKALLSSARLLARARRADELGLKSTEIPFDFGELMERVQSVVRAVAPHDSVERYQALGVDCVAGEGFIEDPFRVRVGERLLTTRSIIVATGAEPIIPPIPGLDRVRSFTSESLWSLRELPKRLVVVGGGPIGCELSQAFARFGSEVTQLEMLPRILAVEDEDCSRILTRRLEEDGVRVLAGHRLRELGKEAEAQFLIAERLDASGAPVEELRIEFDAILLALGRRARVRGFGLEELGVRLDEKGRLARDGFLATNIPNIHACGDVAGPFQFTHAAGHQGWHAAMNALLRPFWRVPVDESVMPWCTFTDPEVARVGVNEQEARARGLAHEVNTYDLAELDRALTEGEAEGFVKVLTPPGKDRILGATVVGPQAGEVLAELVLAMRHGLGLGKILATVHAYPTLGESARFVAGKWRRRHLPRRLLGLAERFHAWRRG